MNPRRLSEARPRFRTRLHRANISSRWISFAGVTSKIAGSVLLTLVAVFLTGCGGLIGLAAGAGGRVAGTGAEYSLWKKSMPATAPTDGRVFIYKSNRTVSPSAMIIGTGGDEIFLIDNEACDVLGGAFIYKDLRAGPHPMSAGDVQMFFSDIAGPYREGKSKLTLNIIPGSVSFIKLSNGNLTQIEPGVAEREMHALPLDTHFATFKCLSAKIEKRNS